MEWIIIVGFAFVMLVVISVITENRKNADELAQSSAYTTSVKNAKNALLTGSGSASSPVLEAAEVGYRPVAKEKLLAVQEGASRIEMKSAGRYRTGGTSISIPIMKGVRYRVSSGSIQTQKTLQETARGRLLVTDKAVVFEGDQRNERMTWTQIAKVDLYIDGYSIAKRSGPPRTYQVDNPDPKFAAVLELMLAQTE